MGPELVGPWLVGQLVAYLSELALSYFGVKVEVQIRVTELLEETVNRRRELNTPFSYLPLGVGVRYRLSFGQASHKVKEGIHIYGITLV